MTIVALWLFSSGFVFSTSSLFSLSYLINIKHEFID